MSISEKTASRFFDPLYAPFIVERRNAVAILRPTHSMCEIARHTGSPTRALEIVPDTNGDGAVDIEDLNNVRNYFGATGHGVLGDTAPFDGQVDIQDLNAVRNNFGAALSSTSPSPKFRGMRNQCADVVLAGHAGDAAGTRQATAPTTAQAADVLFANWAESPVSAGAQYPPVRRRSRR